MPRIRKKTSNRQNTRDRKKITKKVKEHNKKSRKASKKDVTWKSNKKKDTVIPNSFPFKDKVLAEQAEEKRAADEAKIAARRKPVEEEEDAPGIGSVNSTVLTATASLPSVKAVAADAEQDDVPDLVDTQIATLQDCLDRADVVLQVVDARDIAGCRNKWVEGLVSDAGGKFGLIINKVDLVPREALESWLPHLPEHTFLFKSFLPTTNIPASSSSKTQLPHNPEQCLGKEELLAAFAAWATEIKAKKEDKEEPVVVSLFGLPNVGKTSVLNSLLGRVKGKYAVAPVVPLASQAKDLGTTTRAPVEVAVTAAEGVKVHVIDTPGWEPAPEDMDDEEEEEDEDEDGELTEEQMAKFDRMEATLAGDLLRRNIGRIDKIKDVFPLANYVISRSNPQDLMLAYNVPYFTPGDVEGFLTSLARVGARMKKGGEADIDSAARLLMRDWSYNIFPYYSIPPKTSTPNATTPSTAQTSVLGKIRSKKEMRTTGKGLVRFKGGEVDEREVILDDDYTTMGGASDEEDEEDEEDFDEEDEEDDEDDEDAEEIGSDEDVPILIGADEGEELDLEDGPEPSSGSDVEDDDDEDDEDEEEEEEEEVIEDPVAVPKSQLKRKLAEPESEPSGKQAKRARSGTVSSVNGKGKAAANGRSAKRVSFGKDVVLNAKEVKQGKASAKRKR